MFTITSITFTDEQTKKVIEIHSDGKITSDDPITNEEYAACSLYAGLIFGRGARGIQGSIEFV